MGEQNQTSAFDGTLFACSRAQILLENLLFFRSETDDCRAGLGIPGSLRHNFWVLKSLTCS